jgi:hypothetical protein
MTSVTQFAAASPAVFSVLTYSACSSVMLVVNKLALTQLPFPTILTGAQLFLCAIIVLTMSQLGIVSFQNVSFENSRPFLSYCSVFTFGIYSNMQVLERSSLGLVIATRSCLPMFVCTIEVVVMGAKPPSGTSMCSLLGVALLTGVYIYVDHGLRVEDRMQLLWLSVWLSTLTYQVRCVRSARIGLLSNLQQQQMTYGKKMTQTHQMSNWERVFLTNAISLPFTCLLFMAGKERERLSQLNSVLDIGHLHWVFLSCIVGVGISFTGWKLRDEVSATAFTLVGVLNKILTIAINQAVFKDGSLTGSVALVLAILAGLFYGGVEPINSDTAVELAQHK